MNLTPAIFTFEQTRRYFESRLHGQRIGTRREVSAKCPFHDDSTASLSLNLEKAVWHCHACNVGGGLLAFERALTRKDDSACWEAINSAIGRTAPKAGKQKHGQLVATYDYRDADGKLVYQCLRYEGKDFVQRRPDGNGGWVSNMNQVARVPFNLPALITSNVALVAEGEKDCLNLDKAVTQFPNNDGKLTYAATCNIGGAGKWLDSYSPYLIGKKVFVFQDNDNPGRSHALSVCASVSKYAQAVHLVELQGLAPKGDVSDYLRDHSPAELFALMKSTPAWKPAAKQPTVIDASSVWDRAVRGDEAMGVVLAGASDDTARMGEFADDALALKFTALHGNDLRFTAQWGRWNLFDGLRWRTDETLHVFDLARAVCRAAANSGTLQRAARIASAQTIAAVERLARADRIHAMTVDQWDADPWLLNTPSGVVDLRNGELRSAARSDYMTKITAVAPSGECRLWLSFLSRITDGNEELQRFVQRMCGYALTGVTQEHALFFLYGTGGNGKGVFLNTISGILGDYAKIAPIEAFIASKNERHPTDLAGLRGARLVTAIETDEGRRWAESKIKALTGGDRIAARFMRQDFFDYVPQFKLIIAGNHKPGLRTVDEAMRRRFNLVPFMVTVPAGDRDQKLADKLREEWGAILQWMIEGCLAWQSEGLQAPKAVSDATKNYLDSEDVLARWIEDRCHVNGTNWASATALFTDWRAWCEQNQEYAGSQKSFSQSLESRGFTRKPTTSARGFLGIGLMTDVTGSPDIPVARAPARIRPNGDDLSHPSHKAADAAQEETQPSSESAIDPEVWL